MKYVFIVIGVGGTGSLLARDIPKLLIELKHKMILVDGDMVEERNMVRQSYQRQDIGEKKANALTKKINTFYGNVCESVDKYVTDKEIIEVLKKYDEFIPVIIGCVDNDKTRMLLEKTFHLLKNCIYLDSANSEYEGNVYVKAKMNNNVAGVMRSERYELATDIHPSDKSCEQQASEGNVQYLVTNMKMAMVLLEHVTEIVHGELKEGVTVVNRFEEVHYR